MEGPSLLLASQQLAKFKGKTVSYVSGNTKISKEIFLHKKVYNIFSWGKHLVFQFDTIALRVHFLLFGTYEAVVDGIAVTGDYKRSRETRLTLTFPNGEVKLFNCSVKIFETSDLKNTYDFTIDVLSKEWDERKAFQHIEDQKTEEIADILLDQEIFAGVGNIIKNEILSLTFINPKTRALNLTKPQLEKLIFEAEHFSHQFYTWRKAFILRKHLKIHRKTSCPHCGQKIIREKTGKRNRWSYYCSHCQPLIK